MNINKKTALLILSGLSIFFPMLYFLPGVLAEFYRASFPTEVVIAICFGLISTACVHTNELFTPWDEFIENRYPVRSLKSDPWKIRGTEYTSAQNTCFAHFVVTFIYSCVLFTEIADKNFITFPVTFLCFAYYLFISIMFFRRSWKLSDSMKENWRPEQRWARVKKAYGKLIKSILNDAKWTYYTEENLHEELPLDIRDQVEADLKKYLEEFNELADCEKEVIIEDAWKKVFRKGRNYKSKAKCPQC